MLLIRPKLTLPVAVRFRLCVSERPVTITLLQLYGCAAHSSAGKHTPTLAHLRVGQHQWFFRFAELWHSLLSSMETHVLPQPTEWACPSIARTSALLNRAVQHETRYASYGCHKLPHTPDFLIEKLSMTYTIWVPHCITRAPFGSIRATIQPQLVV